VSTFVFVLSIICLFYVLLLIVTSNQVIGLLGNKYRGSEDSMLLWGRFFFLYTIRFQPGTALIVYKNVK